MGAGVDIDDFFNLRWFRGQLLFELSARFCVNSKICIILLYFYGIYNSVLYWYCEQGISVSSQSKMQLVEFDVTLLAFYRGLGVDLKEGSISSRLLTSRNYLYRIRHQNGPHHLGLFPMNIARPRIVALIKHQPPPGRLRCLDLFFPCFTPRDELAYAAWPDRNKYPRINIRLALTAGQWEFVIPVGLS